MDITNGCSNVVDVDFKEQKYYLDISQDKVNVYTTIVIKQLNEIKVNSKLNAIKLYDNLIIGSPRKEDLTIYSIEDKEYYRFRTNQNDEGRCVYSGCSKFTTYSFDTFEKSYHANDTIQEICNEFSYFSSKEAVSDQPERKLIFLRQIEYLFYFFKNDKAHLKLLEKYQIEGSIQNISNKDIVHYVLRFYNLGEYDNGLFKKFSSISNTIDDQIIEYIAEEVINIRNGIAHINDKTTYTIRHEYFDLISEISYLMLLQYLGVSFINQNAPTLHMGTKEPGLICMPKPSPKVASEKVKTPTKSENKSKAVKKVKPIRKKNYKFFTHGYLESLDKKTYVVKLNKILKEIDKTVISQNIAIQLDGNVKLDSKLSSLAVDDADIIYSNGNKNYKKIIAKHPNKMIIFVNRKELVLPKKRKEVYTHRNKAK